MKSKILFWLMIIAVPGCFLMTGIAIMKNPSWFSWFGFDQSTAFIGDTIGGITAPILGFLSAILIYVSFHEQFKANEQQKRVVNTELKRNNLLKEYEQIISLIDVYRNEVDSMEYSDKSGVNLIHHYVDTIVYVNFPLLEYITPKLGLSLGIFRTILEKIEKYGNYISNDDKELIQARNQDIEMLKVRMNIEFTRIENPLSTLSQENNYNVQLKAFQDYYIENAKLKRFETHRRINDITAIRIQSDLRVIFNESNRIYKSCSTIPQYTL